MKESISNVRLSSCFASCTWHNLAIQAWMSASHFEWPLNFLLPSLLKISKAGKKYISYVDILATSPSTPSPCSIIGWTSPNISPLYVSPICYYKLQGKQVHSLPRQPVPVFTYSYCQKIHTSCLSPICLAGLCSLFPPSPSQPTCRGAYFLLLQQTCVKTSAVPQPSLYQTSGLPTSSNRSSVLDFWSPLLFSFYSIHVFIKYRIEP